MKHYNYLLRCLPLAQRAKFQKQGVASNNVVWAFHSESEEELLSLVPSYSKGSPRWSTLKELGVGWWLRNHTLLKTCMEKVRLTQCFSICAPQITPLPPPPPPPPSSQKNKKPVFVKHHKTMFKSSHNETNFYNKHSVKPFKSEV